jgi:hypothetical protein
LQNTAERHAILRNVFDDILKRVTDATSFGKFHSVLLTHRSLLYNSQSLLMPPKVEIRKQQEVSGLGAVAEVPNQSNYSRTSKARKAIAQKKDPTCYSLHKTAAHNAQVVCACGETVVNDHHMLYNHRKRKRHVDWLASYFAGIEDVPARGDEGDEGDQGDDGDEGV